MNKLILRAYGLIAILFLFLIGYGLFNLRLSVTRKTNLTGYEEITEYTEATVKDEDAPLGEKTVITFRLREIRSDYNTLLFMTAHQNVSVYLGLEKIYDLRAKSGIFLPKSPGVVYNEVVFSDADKGRTIRVELEPVYEGLNNIPDFMLGNGYQIIKVILFSNLPILLLCTAAISIGILQIFTALASGKNEEHMSIALTHSTFTIVVGIWKCLDSDFIALFAKELPVLTVLPFVILMFLPLMIKKVIMDVLNTYETTAWKIPNVVSLIGIATVFAMQFFGIADFRESLWVSEACLAISFLCTLFGIIGYVKDNGFDRDAKAGSVCWGLGLLWMAIDIYTYFGTTGVTKFPVSMFLFLLFLLMLLYGRMKASRQRMEVGMKARAYKKLAYHDALTGFFNRAAYMDFLSSSEFNLRKSILVAFDLNNLKKCNDELGHDKGDIYIKEAAKIIMDCFGERGRCYRLGGDEFGAILLDDSMEACEKRAKRMRDRVAEFNKRSDDIHMGIACGFAIFDETEDEDVHATIRRADKMMYEEKFRMKQQGA